MGRCVKCNGYCKDEHDYCYYCYWGIVQCSLCKKTTVIEEDHSSIKNNEQNSQIIICKECRKNVIDILINDENKSDTRNKYPTNFRTEDNHNVRSRGEVIIDNYLFNKKIRHIYEKKVHAKINNEFVECTTDFYLPDYDVYIEFWGIENNEDYQKTKKFKEQIYEFGNLKKIDIYPTDIDNNIDDFMTKELLKIQETKD